MQAATYPLRKLALPAIVASLSLMPVHGAGQDRIGAYDFSYQLTGDARAKPVHVFDDGKDTFFQFRTGEPVPAIFIEGAGGAQLLVPQLEGPYVKVAAVSDGFALRLGFGTAKVAYIGGVRRRASVAPPAAPPAPEPQRRPDTTPPPLRLLAASQPVHGLPHEMLIPTRPRIALEESSYATPLKGDAVEWMTPREAWREHEVAFGKDSARLTPTAQKLVRSVVADAKPGTRFEVIGRDDAGHKESLAEARARAMTAALVSAGAAKTNVQQRTTVDVKEAGHGLSWGATLRVQDPGTQRPGSMRIDEASALQRQRSGTPAPQEGKSMIAAGNDSLRPSFPERIAGAAPAMPTPVVWAVRKSDATLERMLDRWARDCGWTLVWQGGPTVAITGDATLSRPDYLQAADYVIDQARAAGYRMRATAYSNQTLVISEE
jgi:outer membrane protein OmpA-like peptidoglycan-associated protein